MLGVKNYAKEDINACRAKVDSDINAFRSLVTSIQSLPGDMNSQIDSALAALAASCFGNLVLVLNEMFVHRLRTVEGKDGNPLNEVLVFSDSILLNHGVMRADSAIKLKPEKSVLKHQVGDEIRLDEARFSAISDAYFAEIEAKFV